MEYTQVSFPKIDIKKAHSI